jgi:hypothetical protein
MIARYWVSPSISQVMPPTPAIEVATVTAETSTSSSPIDRRASACNA